MNNQYATTFNSVKPVTQLNAHDRYSDLRVQPIVEFDLSKITHDTKSLAKADDILNQSPALFLEAV